MPLYSIHYYEDERLEENRWKVIEIKPIRNIDIIDLDHVKPWPRVQYNTLRSIYWSIRLYADNDELALEQGKKRILDDIPIKGGRKL